MQKEQPDEWAEGGEAGQGRKGTSDADATDTVSGACNKVNKEPVRQVDSPFGPAALLFPSAAAPRPRGPSGPWLTQRSGEKRAEGKWVGGSLQPGAPSDQFRRRNVVPDATLVIALSFPISLLDYVIDVRQEP